MATLKNLGLSLISFAKRWPGLIAFIGFLSGIASYFLVERNEALAQILAILMLISWLF